MLHKSEILSLGKPTQCLRMEALPRAETPCARTAADPVGMLHIFSTLPGQFYRTCPVEETGAPDFGFAKSTAIDSADASSGWR